MVTKEKMWGGGINQELEMNIHTLLYIREITNKDLPYSPENSAQYSGIAYMIKVSKMNEYMYMHNCITLPYT